ACTGRLELGAFSLHDALPISGGDQALGETGTRRIEAEVGHGEIAGGVAAGDALGEEVAGEEDVDVGFGGAGGLDAVDDGLPQHLDRKSTRLNSSHVKTSYAVF